MWPIDLLPSLQKLIDHDIDILRSHLRWILFILAGQVARCARGRVAVFIQSDGDVDLASEGYALHHDVLLAE